MGSSTASFQDTYLKQHVQNSRAAANETGTSWLGVVMSLHAASPRANAQLMRNIQRRSPMPVRGALQMRLRPIARSLHQQFVQEPPPACQKAVQGLLQTR